jgi:hypothetical protein
MSMFRRGPRPEDYHVIEDRCWSDPALDALHDGLIDKSRPATDRVEFVLRHLDAVRADAERRVFAATTLNKLLIDCLDVLRATEPTGHREHDADVQGLLALVLTAQAWQFRGRGYASTVEDQALLAFHQILEEADEVGYKALALDPTNPIAGEARLTSGLGLGLPKDEWWTRFEVACKTRPTQYLAHKTMLQAVSQKWHGSHDLMFDFARKVTAAAPIGDPIGAILAIAHAEFLLYSKTLSVPPDDLRLVEEAADRWISGGEEMMFAHPAAYEAHQLFGWLLKEKVSRRAYHLSRSRGRMSAIPWTYLEGDEAVYRALMATAKVTY